MLDMSELVLFSLIMMRMSGFVLFNPIFGRRNVPGYVKAGFIMALSVSVFGFTPSRGIAFVVDNSLQYGGLLLKEMAVGLVLGFVVELFFSFTSFAGGLIDFNMGMSMANVYDPQTNTNMPISGTILNYMMLLLFLAVNGHLALLRIMMLSEQVVPYTQVVLQPGIAVAVLDIFKECIVLGFRLALPIIAIELIGEVGMGVLMKVIPQINVFVINIQAKILFGFFTLLILIYPMGNFIENVIDTMVHTIQEVLPLL